MKTKIHGIFLILFCVSCTAIGTEKITDNKIRNKISNGLSSNEVKQIVGDKNKYNKPLEQKPYWEANSERKNYIEYGFFRKNFLYKGDYTYFVFFDSENKVIDSEYKREVRPLPWITTKSLLEATFCPTYNPDCMKK